MFFGVRMIIDGIKGEKYVFVAVNSLVIFRTSIMKLKKQSTNTYQRI